MLKYLLRVVNLRQLFEVLLGREKAKRIGYEEDLKPVAIEGDPGEFLLRVVKSIAATGVDSEAALEQATAAFATRFRKFETEKKARV